MFRQSIRAAYDGVVDFCASMFTSGLEPRPLARNMIGTFTAGRRE